MLKCINCSFDPNLPFINNSSKWFERNRISLSGLSTWVQFPFLRNKYTATVLLLSGPFLMPQLFLVICLYNHFWHKHHLYKWSMPLLYIYRIADHNFSLYNMSDYNINHLQLIQKSTNRIVEILENRSLSSPFLKAYTGWLLDRVSILKMY